jgi:hypothetical protein
MIQEQFAKLKTVLIVRLALKIVYVVITAHFLYVLNVMNIIHKENQKYVDIVTHQNHNEKKKMKLLFY